MSQPSSNEGVPTVNTQYKMKAIQISNTPLDSLHNKAFLRTGIQFGQYLQDRGEKRLYKSYASNGIYNLKFQDITKNWLLQTRL